jgi:hypothetical protein
MLGSNLYRHIKEFQRYIRNCQYELGDGGVYFPKARVAVAGIYTHDVNGEDERSDRNIIPDEGLNHMLDVVMLDTASAAPWYAMLHSGSGTPTAALTLANYHATLSEITSGSEGYSEATRVLWVGDAIDTANTEVTNSTTPATFTIVTASTLAVNGAALCSVSTKGNYVGTLISAGKFSATRNLANTDVFNLKYKIDFDAV